MDFGKAIKFWGTALVGQTLQYVVSLNPPVCLMSLSKGIKRYYFYIALLDQMVSVALYNLTPGRGLTQP